MPDSITSFTLERSSDGSNWSEVPESPLPGTARSYYDSTVPNDVLYYRLTGHTANGIEFPYNVVAIYKSKTSYVDPNAPDDSGFIRGSISNPARTILGAVRPADTRQSPLPGDTILLLPGLHVISQTIPGIPNGTIQGSGILNTTVRNEVILNHNGVPNNGKSGFTAANNQTFKDFYAYNSTKDTTQEYQSIVGNGWEDTGPGITGVRVQNVHFVGWTDTIQFYNDVYTCGVTVENSTLESYWDIIAMNGAAPHSVVTNTCSFRASQTVPQTGVGSVVGGVNLGRNGCVLNATNCSFYSDRPQGWCISYARNGIVTLNQCTLQCSNTSAYIVLNNQQPNAGTAVINLNQTTVIPGNTALPDSGITGNPVINRT